MHGIGKRVPAAFVCFVVAPGLGVWAGGSMPNPPGNGPGAGQLVVGVALPAILTFITARAARLRPGELVLWEAASLASTAGLVLFLLWFVDTYLPT